ncbi:MAG: alpha-amylase [Lachnospiraceae bacterium]|nr:alpha-amylase [Lachnospiraceae bacterium]
MRKRLIALLLSGVLAVGGLCGCGSKTAHKPLHIIDDKYRTCYEVFVYSFSDSDGDGIGDLNGLKEKLDYINDGDDSTDTDLGCNEIWLMPISPSPSYHKYDVTDYEAIDPQYGSMEDFDALVEECHKRGVRVIIDFVMNHSSSEHPWFTAACDYLKALPTDKEPDVADCPYLDYYHFSREQSDGYTALAGSNWYYEARFWEGMPDLNLQSQRVREEFDGITSFWLLHDVDGFRLDAVTSYETGQPDAIIEELTWFNDMVKSKNPDAYIVGEAWTNRKGYAPFYASGVDSFFDFSFADNNGNIAKVLRGAGTAADFAQSQINAETLYQSYNDKYINAPFYTNHDMARCAGYFTGDNSETLIKMSQGMNLLMQGNAFLYYGEEIGMRGSGADENKRKPMEWDTQAKEAKDPNSIYNFVKTMIRWRNTYPAIARGMTTLPVDSSGNSICTDAICAMERSWEDETIDIIYNISSDEQTVSMPEGSALSDWANASDASVSIIEKDGTLQMPPYSIAILEHH